ncbi:hypothetical protein ACFE04_010116 [Oxalis oulophora]
MKTTTSLGVRKGAWTAEEDKLLKGCVEKHGEGKWHQVPLRAGLNRCRKSCRLRWLNYLKPNINRGQFKDDEVDLILKLHKLLGNRWSLIAGRLPGRTANDIKNYWNTHLHKKTNTTTTSYNLSKQVREKSDEIIVKTKVIRPLPRIFKGNLTLSPLLFCNPGITNNTINSAYDHVQAPCNSSTSMAPREKVEYEVKWWENLLSDDGTTIFPITDGTEDIGPINLWTQDNIESLIKDVDENYIERGFAFDASFLESFD